MGVVGLQRFVPTRLKKQIRRHDTTENTVTVQLLSSNLAFGIGLFTWTNTIFKQFTYAINLVVVAMSLLLEVLQLEHASKEVQVLKV